MSDIKREHCIFCARCGIEERFMGKMGEEYALMLKIVVFGW